MASWQHIVGAGRLLDPAADVDGPGEIWIRDGVIAALHAPGAPAPRANYFKYFYQSN